MYSNLPCPRAYITSDGIHAIVSLRETVSSFLALGIDDLRLTLPNLKIRRHLTFPALLQ
jgi:hypothetical protein